MAARTNEVWLRELPGEGDEQTAGIRDLHWLLRQAARYTLGRTGIHGASLLRGQVEALTEECAQEALVAFLARLHNFRAESKFATFAYKFAVNIALTAARRERWKTVSLDDLLEDREAPAWSLEADPNAASSEATDSAPAPGAARHDLRGRAPGGGGAAPGVEPERRVRVQAGARCPAQA
ncbi:MAG: hypothetical protein IT318_05505 [Anaerolineales bacterium]|nr:hypothetical protein [Anaerolineales bacterium]